MADNADTTVDSDTPVPVREAVKLFFPYGGVTRSTLLAAIRDGQLPYERLGNRYFVTADGIHKWRLSCRVPAKPKPATPPTRAELDLKSRSEIARAAVWAIAKELKAGSKRKR